MSSNNYQKHLWHENELITSAHLNEMEKGIEDAHRKANKQVEEIINDSESIQEIISDIVSNFLFEINEEEQTLIFKINENI